MASIKKRPNGKWRARYRDPRGAERARHFERRIDAERWLDGIRGALVTGSYVDPALGRTTFGPYAEAWANAQLHRPSTAAKLRSDLRNHVVPLLGHRPLNAVSRSEIQAWVKDRSGVLSPAAVEVVFRYVSAIFTAAADDRLISSNPCRGVRLPRNPPRQIVPLTTDAVQALISSSPARFRALITLAAGTGLRQGEALGVHARQIEFLHRLIRVDQQAVTVSGQPPFLGPPKTAASHRSVPVPNIVLEALSAHLREFEPGEGPVFANRDGGLMRRNRFSELWQATVLRAQLPRGTRFHDLRHYYASLLIRHGESVKVVQARLGHASASETLDTYGHLWPDSDDRTRQAVDSVLGHPADSARTNSA